MAQGFNTGIRGPQVAPEVIETPAVFQEGAVSGGQIDWTLQENTIFRALATAVGPAISKWKALDSEARALEASRVEFEYKTTLEEFNAMFEFTSNTDYYRRLIGTSPDTVRRPSYMPGWDNNPHTPEIPAGSENKPYKPNTTDEDYGRPKVVSKPSPLDSDREHVWNTHVGYAVSDDPLTNVSAQNEKLKIQAWEEAKEAGATEEQLRKLIEEWYKPEGGLSRAVYSDTHGWNPAMWEAE